MFCGSCEDVEPYENHERLLLNGRVRGIDFYIHHIVVALNAGRIETMTCCYSHQKNPGRMTLVDDRELVIYDKKAVRRKFYVVWQAGQQ